MSIIPTDKLPEELKDYNHVIYVKELRGNRILFLDKIDTSQLYYLNIKRAGDNSWLSFESAEELISTLEEMIDSTKKYEMVKLLKQGPCYGDI